MKANPERSLRYGELIGDGIKLDVDAKIELKKPPGYKVIGKSIPRVDIPGKVTGEFTYIHDVRVPGMLHARVIRPDDHGARIASVDDSAATPGGRILCRPYARATSLPSSRATNGRRSRRRAPCA